MKKYVKPELVYERYELTEQIAACAWDVKNPSDKGDCQVVGDDANGLGGLTIFTESIQCNVVNPSTEMYCYQPGADGYNSFNS